MTTYHPTFEDFVTSIFRQLPTSVRLGLSVEETSWILAEKHRYYTCLTYSQKCTIAFEKIVLVVQNRLKRKRKKLARKAVRSVLRAEEKYYWQTQEVFGV